MDYEVKHICTDMEISARIYVQIVQFTNIVQVPPYTDEAFKGPVFKIAQDLMSKLSSVRHHKENFLRRYAERLEHHRSRNPNEGGTAFHIEEEKELVGDLEAFLFQVKSSLDIATKLLIPCAGFGVKKAETFSDAGSGVIKLLKKDHIRKSLSKDRLDHLIKLIEWNQKEWIEEVVDARTNTIHREATQGLSFRFAKEDGKAKCLLPVTMWRGGNASYPDYLSQVEQALFDFCRDFVAFSLYLKAPPMVTIKELSPDQAIKRWNTPEGRHVRWELALHT